MHTTFWSDKPKEGDRLEGFGVDWRIIQVLKK
jgi:hypothetical protein